MGTDEASLLERAGIPVAVVHGSQVNLKITQPGDLELAEFYLRQRRTEAELDESEKPDAGSRITPDALAIERRLGDHSESWTHASDLAMTRTNSRPGVPLRIGGMTLDHPEGLAGHSDGDVLLHAITDALLGAVAAGDIGSFFPPGDPRWKDADSAIFLNLALEELQHAGYRIVNVDTTLILAAPKIAPIAGEMRARVADLLGVDIDQVSIKAKTPEGLNLDHVAQCHAVALVERVQEPEELKSMSEVIESQRQLEDVVEDLLSSVHGVPKKRTVAARLRHRRHHVEAGSRSVCGSCDSHVAARATMAHLKNQ